MEVNFDKQVDTILRELAKRDTFTESSPLEHLDADELVAFAENVLPGNARLRATEHLADCPSCRKILSTFVLLGKENESETLHKEVKNIAAVSGTPWYRRIFAFPKISYAVGAMALLLVGMVGFLVLQNSQNLKSDVAMSEPSSERAKGPSSITSSEPAESESFSANSSNTIANVDSNTTSASENAVSRAVNSTADAPLGVSNGSSEIAKSIDTPVTVGQSDSANARKAKSLGESEQKIAEAGGPGMKKTVEGAGQPLAEAVPSATPAEKRLDEVFARQQTETTQSRVVQNNQIMTPDGGDSKRNLPPAAPAAKPGAVQLDISSGDKDESINRRSQSKSSASKTVGGRTFSIANGIWMDSNYRGGETTNIRRGTDEYKKLDSGLRSTAEQLGGTVIIVWKGKNYKIQ